MSTEDNPNFNYFGCHYAYKTIHVMMSKHVRQACSTPNLPPRWFKERISICRILLSTFIEPFALVSIFHFEREKITLCQSWIQISYVYIFRTLFCVFERWSTGLLQQWKPIIILYLDRGLIIKVSTHPMSSLTVSGYSSTRTRVFSPS